MKVDKNVKNTAGTACFIVASGAVVSLSSLVAGLYVPSTRAFYVIV